MPAPDCGTVPRYTGLARHGSQKFLNSWVLYRTDSAGIGNSQSSKICPGGFRPKRHGYFQVSGAPFSAIGICNWSPSDVVENWTIEQCALWSRFSFSREWATNAAETQSLFLFRDRQKGAKLPDLNRRGKPDDTADCPITQVPTVQDLAYTPMRAQPRPHSLIPALRLVLHEY